MTNQHFFEKSLAFGSFKKELCVLLFFLKPYIFSQIQAFSHKFTQILAKRGL